MKSKLFQELSPMFVLVLLGLMSLGAAGNLLSVSLFFGVDFIFGSIATLLVIAAFGPGWGMIATLLASLLTIYLWNHPFAAIALIGEGLFVSTLLRRFRYNLALAAGTYWVVIGIPIVWFFYHYAIGMDSSASTLAAVKQGTNGIVNAIVASLLLSYLPLFRSNGAGAGSHLTVFQHIFNIFVAVAIVPSLAVVVVDAKNVVSRVEQQASSRLTTISTGISLSVELWRSQHLKAISTVAKLISDLGVQNRNQLQKIVATNKSVWPDFHGTFVTNEQGRTIAFDPLVNQKGESTLGIDFSDREYFQDLKGGAPSPHISHVFMARGGTFEPVFNVSAAVQINGHFAGVASSSMNLRQLNDILEHVPGETGYFATVVDSSGKIISSNDSRLKSLADYENSFRGTVEDLSRGFYHRWPEEEKLSPMSKWSRSSLGRMLDIPGPGNWKLIVEIPMFAQQSLIFERYIRSLSFLLGLAMVILLGSWWVAGRISSPLAQLSKQTTNLPERLQLNEKIQWPSSNLEEVKVLIANFRSTVEALKRRFLDLQVYQAQLKQAKEDAEIASNLKSAFLANMSHEIRTPLGVMIGFAELIAEDHLSPDDREQYLQILKRNGRHLSGLIDDILDLSKVEAGHLSIDVVSCSLRQVILDSIADHQISAQQKNISLKAHFPDTINDSLRTDPRRLKQILINLISNALKFTEAGEIQVSVAEIRDRIEIEVKDTGIGISTADQNKLFQRFTQGDSSMTRKFGGTGLGLALSKRLCQLLGGDLHLKESQPGLGSTFRFTIQRYLPENSLTL